MSSIYRLITDNNLFYNFLTGQFQPAFTQACMITSEKDADKISSDVLASLKPRHGFHKVWREACRIVPFEYEVVFLTIE